PTLEVPVLLDAPLVADDLVLEGPRGMVVAAVAADRLRVTLPSLGSVALRGRVRGRTVFDWRGVVITDGAAAPRLASIDLRESAHLLRLAVVGTHGERIASVHFAERERATLHPDGVPASVEFDDFGRAELVSSGRTTPIVVGAPGW